ncbi:YecA family protein [Haloplasma contractile]|uniref:SECA protein n=1 Tax=Haloplasma contractile SSD-17B TaxID=1033810 RepID=F7Q1T5_9MOLU|nr:SEC-C metal-binding domain-containing protein [Haloplasma contractile]ERJ12252.1 SECA protein [Haloplasma contractile SSD-17B]
MPNKQDHGKMILDGLMRMKDDFENRRQRDMWKYKYKGNSIHDCLSLLTKDHLNDIRNTLLINIPSNLKKADLLERLETYFYRFLKTIFPYFTNTQYEFIKKLVQNNGILRYKEKDEKIVLFLLKAGIAFPVMMDSEQVVILPKETIEFYETEVETPELINMFKHNTEMIKATKGLLQYYGILSYDMLIKIMVSFYPDLDIDFGAVIRVVKIEVGCNNHLTEYRGYLHLSGIDWKIIDPIIEDPQRANYDYYPINKFRAISAGSPSFLEETPEIKHLMAYLNYNFNINQDELKELMRELVFYIRTGQHMNIYMKLIEANFEISDIEEAQEIANMLQALHNNTRLWPLKGYTPLEARESTPFNVEAPVMETSKVNVQAPFIETFHTKVQAPIMETSQSNIQDSQTNNPTVSKPKVGRNAPCPCGSGKKYKKCCLEL